jgi:DNA ligase-associated metallophosphoesterase
MSALTHRIQAVECCGEQLLLRPDKTVYWPARKTLLAADIHIGKEHTFARAGIPIPGGLSESTLDCLMNAVDATGAERLIVLGDLLHATPRLSEPWQIHLHKLLSLRNTLELQVVIGNHDSSTARQAVMTSLHWVDIAEDPPFVFRHEPAPCTNGYVIAGHIHPAYLLKAGRRQQIRAPVFWFRQHSAVLPAFGAFTGGHLIQREPADRLFLVDESGVFQI